MQRAEVARGGMVLFPAEGVVSVGKGARLGLVGELQETTGAKAQGVLGAIWSLAPSWGQRGATMGEVTLMPHFSPYLRKETDPCARHSSCAQSGGRVL